MSHTPAPWVWDDEFLFSKSVPEGTPSILALHPAYGYASAADRTLIKAAPDLLAACQRVVRLLEQKVGQDAVLDQALQQVRDAVARAEHGT